MFVKHSESIRKAVIQAYHAGSLTIRRIAKLFCIGVQTIYRWLKQSQQLEILQVRATSHAHKITPSIE